MSELRFDGQVAIVTGAGGLAPSLGRAHALFLASRGAKVVVNDLGTGPDGRGLLRANAEEVVEQIRQAGGEAVADTNSVADPDGAAAVVKTAIDAFGAVHILVNNAGLAHLATFDALSESDIRKMTDVHLLGPIWMCRAAWPHMQRQRYGRIVNVGSSAMFGSADTSVYGAAKAGAYTLSKGLAAQGVPHDIKVNTLLPRAGTLAITHLQAPSQITDAIMRQPTEHLPPVVALLAHRDCPCTGKGFEAGGGRVIEIAFAATAGYQADTIDLEDLVANWSDVVDRTDIRIMPDMVDDIRITPKPYIPG
jgi:NAD(P)-dependent dehydrogenase (short-subunit alcohol dehydrogenase family)